ncbi:hypothetical protein HPB52_021339 [Rhipicephalus sanguineus]|uniref:Uncharacterized protein n=1 Tax=Rhipicephalus sanguineus TaxID=34632 RepID=A0A9D4PF61_RHISA|nr:hypothetical protein HPB52_021339 [Rhipicephalus sanguineus]
MEPSEVTSERDHLLSNEPCAASVATAQRSLGKNKSCHILNGDSRNMIFHCYTCWRNTEPEHSVADTSKFVADMLGVSERTVFRDGIFDILHAKYIKHVEGALCCIIVGFEGGKWRGSCK